MRDVVPRARRERDEREVSVRRGAEKGVEEIGWEEGFKRSWVWRWVEREVEYATESSVGWNIVHVSGWPWMGVNVANDDYV